MEVWFCAIAGTDAARHNALIETASPNRIEAERGQTTRCSTAPTLRSAAQRHSTLRMKNRSARTAEQRGTPSPLTKLIMEVPNDFEKPPA